MVKHYVNQRIVLLLDNVVYHKTDRVKRFLETLPVKVECKLLLPYSSELNAIEHLWKDVRWNVTHNHLFDNLKETFAAIRKYFMNGMRSPAKIRRLCAYIY